ncbi:MAG: putative baseplate assembly protein [ANME-2 cluster archaeon]|nr:MAG: putative baseplate assembly protein [ANME-2 cluster archaeon]
MGIQYYCKNEKRRQGIRQQSSLNGIDFLEILDDRAPEESPRQCTLLVYFINPAPYDLDSNNIRIYGGVRVTEFEVKWAVRGTEIESLFNEGLINEEERVAFLDLDKLDHLLLVRTDVRGDFSNYHLCLVQSQNNPQPPVNMDPILSCVEFSFKIDCPSEFDCKVLPKCAPERAAEPLIDYMAKDYASFRRMMLDRLSIIMPDWKERNQADLGIALVELLAYAGDHLSYYLDAVATESYLNTARKRVSLRRHSRILDYPMHDGCNSRVWVCFEVTDGNVVHLKKEDTTTGRRTRLLTKCGEKTVLDDESFTDLISTCHPEVFELLHDVSLYSPHNPIYFYTWDNELCCLPKGATSATLKDNPENRLLLRPGDVLILEELIGAATGEDSDANTAHRHAVRLTHVYPEVKLGDDKKRTPDDLVTDPLTGQAIMEIRWHPEDSLPFPLCISTRVTGNVITDMACVRGNVVLADHGHTFEKEVLEPSSVPTHGAYTPLLSKTDITFSCSYDHDTALETPASSDLLQEPSEALAVVQLNDDREIWSSRRDLLSSDRFAQEFVVEMENNGTAQLRFGDNVLGKKPASGATLKAAVRVGNGYAGNIGAEAISHIDPLENTVDLPIERLWNPLPAYGGIDGEKMEEVRLNAPQAFRVQQRAVTAADYADVVQRHDEIQKAVATLRWTGSWYTMFITVDRKGGREVDDNFRSELLGFLERFRMAGHDVEINAPQFVPLDIAFTVCVVPGYMSSEVKLALLEKFSNIEMPDRQRGFFHPDNFTFAQPVYLSNIVAEAMQVPGVMWIDTHRFKRWRQPSLGELDDGMIKFEPLEIGRLDNDPNFPENGKIEFIMKGGI